MLTWTRNDAGNHTAEGTAYFIEKGKGRFYLCCDSERLFTGSLSACKAEALRLHLTAAEKDYAAAKPNRPPC